MANTKTTTRISLVRYGIGAAYAVLAFFSLVNLFLTMTPVAKGNTSVDAYMEKAQSMPADAHLDLFRDLQRDQEKNLAEKPSEPYGWARLAYLRYSTEGDQKSAFAALRMSDLVSPYEAPQLPERAVMWYRLRSVETADQQAYQDALWAKAFQLQPDLMWNAAVSNNLVDDIEKSLKKTHPSLDDAWKTRMSSRGKS